MLETKESFLEYRRSQESKIASESFRGGLVGVLTVELNITDLCNRKCNFCPRVDPVKYPNRKVFISDDTIFAITSQLRASDYKGKVSFSGFGEPLLNKNFPKIVAKFRKELDPGVILETNTNGDKLTPDALRELFDSGLNALYWNLYDGMHQLEIVDRIVRDSGVDVGLIRVRPHWPGFNDGIRNLFLNNRGGTLLECNPVDFVETSDFPLKRGCNYPFYKIFIDWDGSVLSCSNDWFRKSVLGNINKAALSEIWFSQKQNELRHRLLRSDRNCSLCERCDVDGKLLGESSIQALKSQGLI